MPGTWYTSTQVLLCTTTCFVLQGTTFFAARYSYYEPHRVPRAELREDLHRRKAVRRTTRMFWGEVSEFRSPAPLSSPKERALKVPGTTYLVPDNEYQVLLLCTCFVFQGATFCGQLVVGNFLSAGLGSSPIYSSLISVQSVTFAVYSINSSSDAWYVAWQYFFLLSSSTRRRFYPQRPPGQQAVVTGVVPSPPQYVPSILSRVGFSIPTARRFSSNVANSRSRAFRW